jgi:hypothetical protein
MAIVADTDTRWSAALDELEMSIERFAQLALTAYGTDTGAPTVPEPFVLPGDLGPVPDELRDRADELVGRSESVQTELHRVRDLVAAQIAGLHKAPQAHAYHDDRDPSYLDEVG